METNVAAKGLNEFVSISTKIILFNHVSIKRIVHFRWIASSGFINPVFI